MRKTEAHWQNDRELVRYNDRQVAGKHDVKVTR